MNSLTLTPDELHDLTHKVRPSAQVRALHSMGIDHKVRPDGTVAVLRSHVETPVSVVEPFEINWD